MLTRPEAREQLQIDFESAAAWRRRKAIRSPNDNCNAEAARLLDRLAVGVKDIDDATMDAYSSLYEEISDSEFHSELLREVGFHWWPEGAGEFVQRFISEQSGG